MLVLVCTHVNEIKVRYNRRDISTKLCLVVPRKIRQLSMLH